MNRSFPARGFTLLELLVAVTITMVIATLMLTVTDSVLTLWRRSQAGHTQATTAKLILDLMEQDLQAAIHRRDPQRWLAVDILDTASALANHGWLTGTVGVKPANGGSLLPLPPPDARGASHLRDARFGLSGAWLRFVTAQVESGGSLPVVVAYQVVRRPVTGDPVPANPAAVRYALYRSAVGNLETLALGYDVMAAGYDSPTNRPDGAGSTEYRAGRNVMNPGHANLLGSNVVDFGCWLFRRNPDGTLRRIYPAAAGDTSHHAVGQSTAAETSFPEVVDVMLRILTEEGAAQVEAIEANRIPARPPAYATDAEWWWAVVEANSRVFTRRIAIMGGAP